MSKQKLVKNFLTSLPRRFVHIVAAPAPEQVLDLKTTMFEDVVGRLKAYEERVKQEDKANDSQENLLYARTEYSNGNNDLSGGKGRGSYSRGRGRGRGQGCGQGNSQNQGQRDSSKNREDNKQKAKKGWKIHHLEVKTTFINGNRKKLDSTLKELGFLQCVHEKAVYRMVPNEEFIIVAVNKDDIFMTGMSLDLINVFKRRMASQFEMSDLGELTYYLGIKVSQGKDFVEIKQERYAMKI
uniref:Reverse transcriptase Ty1/copia-type domain-containing protein n=1 Tax=Tanacetum cinerariifolium TaxID=118510 RepID=A0A699GL66_TANCI|nr:hypothetical protein [Tanacetum cinerariifolium]